HHDAPPPPTPHGATVTPFAPRRSVRDTPLGPEAPEVPEAPAAARPRGPRTPVTAERAHPAEAPARDLTAPDLHRRPDPRPAPADAPRRDRHPLRTAPLRSGHAPRPRGPRGSRGSRRGAPARAPDPRHRGTGAPRRGPGSRPHRARPPPPPRPRPAPRRGPARRPVLRRIAGPAERGRPPAPAPPRAPPARGHRHLPPAVPPQGTRPPCLGVVLGRDHVRVEEVRLARAAGPGPKSLRFRRTGYPSEPRGRGSAAALPRLSARGSTRNGASSSGVTSRANPTDSAKSTSTAS